MANELKLDVKVTGAQKGAQDLNQVAAATDKTAQATKATVGANDAAATSATGLNDAIGQLAGRNNDAKDALEGITQAAKGNEGALFSAAKAWKGLVGVFSGAAGPFGLIVLALTGVKAALDFIVQKSTDAKNAMQDFAGQGERTASALKQVEDASKKALADAKQQVEELTEVYKTLNGQIDAAAQRVDKLNSAQTALKLAQLDQEEAQALSTASPDQNLRDGIRRDFSRRREDIRAQGERTRLENTSLKAGVEEKAATEALAGFRQQLDAASAATREAENFLAGERSKLANVDAETVNTDYGRQLRDAVKVAEAAAKAARDNEAAVREALQPQVEAASRQIQEAKDTRTLVGVQQQTLATETAARTTTRTNEDIDLKRKQEQERQAAQIKAQTSSVESSPGLEAQPLEQAVQQQGQAVVDKFAASNAGIQTVAATIVQATEQMPPPVDVSGIGTAFAAHHQAVLTRFTTLQQQVTDLQRQIQTMTLSIQNSR